MKDYLIALDLDGTLLTDNKNISSRNRAAIAKVRQLGHKVVIATGRPYRASKSYYDELLLDSPMVNFNGAFIHHPVYPKSFQPVHTPLEKNVAKTIIQTCEAFQVENIMVEIMDEYYLRYENKGFAEAFTLGQSPVEYGNLQQILQADPTSILIHPKETNHQQLKNLIHDAHAEFIEQRSWGAPWNVIEIVKYGLNKAIGLKRIAQYYNIPQERIIAFGDEDNDLEMIEYAGHGIAMDNAIAELKNISNEQTLTNEEDGVAVYLERFFSL
ncbi:Cof-type HAD-IIB family hydrolase [Evansella cellulosilytica]|uniref:Cof-like hydrolase n=1 Tax=Evansella cellulosilytica (strain ATCC 21833 / DSM 2522 / FERM P-1141 / JCM 9156 / N-4) TaxID=649639 RepID=E6TXY4_EVAC2|nr:Cof-type HAD-IIB family hydrolase [Evansella cellulosilytica]ADU31197.1 Cof-like hydrolase [Evansella cellulosilytica DSM 2522]